MNPIQKAIAEARRRVVAAEWLRWLGWGACLGLGAALVVLTGTRLAGARAPGAVYAAIAGVALAAATVAAALRRPGHAQVAGLIDQRLKLKDRLATALYARGLAADPFARQVVHDAQDAAARLVLREAFPVRPSRVWAWAAPAAAALALVWFFLPADALGLGRARQQARRQQQQQQQQQAEAQEQILKTVEAIRKFEPPQGDPAAPQDLAKLSNALTELTRQSLTTPEMQKQAVTKLSDVQDRLNQAADAKAQQVQTLQNTLSRLDAGQPGPADRFADALRRGDYAGAMTELDRLAREAQDLNEADRQALQQQLQNLAQQLAQAAAQQQQQQQQAGQQMQQALQNAGLTPQQAQQAMQQAQQGASQQQMQQQLQQQGLSPPQAQQMAQQLAQMQQQQQGQGQCQNCTQGLGQALSQMSQQAGGSAGQPQQGAGQAQQQLSQLAQMQQQLQQLRQAQQQAQQAGQSLAQASGGGGGQRLGPWNFNKPQRPGTGQPQTGVGPGIGNEPGGDPMGPERQMGPYQTDAHGDIGQGEGRVIASWLSPGPVGRGEPTVAFNQAVQQAQQEAEKAITDDRVPARYHPAIKGYFSQLPQTPQDVQKPPQ